MPRESRRVPQSRLLLGATALALVSFTAQGENTPYPGKESPPRSITRCQMADGSFAELLGQPDGYTHETPLLNMDGETRPAFQDVPDMDYVGQALVANCQGQALYFVYQGMSPYLKGALVRKNPETYKTEVILFAEKATPLRLYLSTRGMLVVIPNAGHETDKKYLVYRYPVLNEDEQPLGLDRLPARGDYEILDLAPIKTPDA